jgi:ATP-dependent DNA helicase PIF1
VQLFTAIDRFCGNPGRAVQARLLEVAEKKAPATLSLKVGAQVILTKNMPELGLVNGSRGVVRGFRGDDTGSARASTECAMVEFAASRMVLVRPQSVYLPGGGKAALVRTTLPLNLAWALTVHKSQVCARRCVA